MSEPSRFLRKAICHVFYFCLLPLPPASAFRVRLRPLPLFSCLLYSVSVLAKSPEQVHLLFAEYFSAGNLEGLISLYSPEAAFVQKLGEPIRGHARIRETLRGFLERGGRMDLKVVAAYTAGDLALLLSDWTIYRETLGKPEVISTGRTSDVVRRQSEGNWLLVIDNPDGVATDAT